ncbi:hypothetical protein TRFO_16270 [Tritrichomonas foetus]|uniref:Stealth protein CR2 conserved region 2 domain-containing protein n=1 Tax=Tritrichomonas foetus TaxID=1144522 RepID=A0A1J4KQZ1_9EUKA|nr:hypothetical protein TRFO_16270 [Tritrichomonas foetus]|eukprot:OHT13514.1 hypothetical protein TRFO_16270 [Tritrichomonas foetus]
MKSRTYSQITIILILSNLIMHSYYIKMEPKSIIKCDRKRSNPINQILINNNDWSPGTNLNDKFNRYESNLNQISQNSKFSRNSQRKDDLSQQIDNFLSNQKSNSSLSKSPTNLSQNKFPIDAVYTWVNGKDEKWVKLFKEATAKKRHYVNREMFAARFEDNDELRYSLRTLEKYAKFFRYIHIVTYDGNGPKWMNISHPKIRMVSHSQIFTKHGIDPLFDELIAKASLPLFNSNAIEVALCNVPDLAEHFVYLNDDCFFGKKVKRSTFFNENGIPQIFTFYKDFHRAEVDYLTGISRYQNRDNNNGYQFVTSIHFTVKEFQQKMREILNQKYKLNSEINENISYYTNEISAHVAFPSTKTLWRLSMSFLCKDVQETLSHQTRSISDVQIQTLIIQYGKLHGFVNTIMVKDESDLARFIVVENECSLDRVLLIYQYPPLVFSINIDSPRLRSHITGFFQDFVPNPSGFEIEEFFPKKSRIGTKYWKRVRSRMMIRRRCY